MGFLDLASASTQIRQREGAGEVRHLAPSLLGSCGPDLILPKVLALSALAAACLHYRTLSCLSLTS